MSLLDRVKNAAKLVVEAGNNVAETTIKVATTTQQAYREGGTEAVGKLAGQATRQAVVKAQEVGNTIVDNVENYVEESKKIGHEASQRANLIRNNDTDKKVTANVLGALAILRQIRDDAEKVGKNAINKLDNATKPTPK